MTRSSESKPERVYPEIFPGPPILPDATNPDYYKFSNGAETIDITENLTGNGAQAVQYIVRATRADGLFKGDRVEDLEKAGWFVRRELGRIRSL